MPVHDPIFQVRERAPRGLDPDSPEYGVWRVVPTFFSVLKHDCSATPCRIHRPPDPWGVMVVGGVGVMVVGGVCAIRLTCLSASLTS